MGKTKLGVLVVAIACAAALPIAPAGSVEEPVPVVRVDAGGAGAAGTPTWQADTASSPNPLGNGAAVGAGQVRAASGAVSLADPSIPAGTPAAVFRTVRSDWKAAAPNLTWKLPTTKAQARVRLYFAELEDTIRAGGRVFDVLVEGALVDDDLDVVARTGGVRRGLVRTYDVAVAGPTVDIVFRWKVKPPAVAGLELLEAPEPPPPPPPPDVVPTTRIDAGGAGLADSPPWLQDGSTTPTNLGNGHALGTGQVASTTAAIDTSHPSLPAGTPADVLRTLRVDKSIAKPNLAYVLPVPGPGTYAVRAYFVEVHSGYTGSTSRVQDVLVNGQLVDNDLDVAGRAGGVLKAFARTYTVTTTTSQPAIQVELARVRQAPAIAAVELLAAPAEPVDLPGAWTDLGTSPRLGEDGFAVLDGYMYRAGGQIFVGYQQIVSTTQHDRYDPRTGEWTALPPLPTPVDHVQAIAYDGRVWYVGGTTGGAGTGVPRGATGQVTSYDPVSGQLTSHAPMPRPRGAGGIAAFDGRIYYFGGLVSPTQTSAQADVYDIATDTWSQLPDLPVAKDHFKAVVLGTDIHLPGGRPGLAALAMTRHDVFDTVGGTYRSAAALPIPLGGAGLTVLDGKLLIAGGETRVPDAARRDVFSYDPLTDQWTALEPLRVARHGIDLAVCGNAAYVSGGMGHFGATNVNDTVEAFTLDGSAPDCPLTAPPEAVARTGSPSAMEPSQLPEVRRVAARIGAAGAGQFCTI